MTRRKKQRNITEILHVQDYAEPPKKKRDSRDFYESRDGKPFCVSNPDKMGGIARDATGRYCCEYKLEKRGDRVVAIHAGDVLIKAP